MFADNNFKLDENGSKFFRKVENTMGKGETAHYEQLLLFPKCFQKTFSRFSIFFGKLTGVLWFNLIRRENSKIIRLKLSGKKKKTRRNVVYKYYLPWGELFITGEYFLQIGWLPNLASIFRFFSSGLRSHAWDSQVSMTLICKLIRIMPILWRYSTWCISTLSKD